MTKTHLASLLFGLLAAACGAVDVDGAATADAALLTAAKPPACTADAQCDDGDPCTQDECALRKCRSRPLSGGVHACYDGPAGTAGVGACVAGTATCVKGVATSCRGQVVPQVETCANAIDDDCDGRVNEEGAQCACAPGATASCYDGADGTAGVGACGAGTTTCDALGTAWGACVGATLPAPETCGDGVDDDCDGTADDGCAPPPSDVGAACSDDAECDGDCLAQDEQAPWTDGYCTAACEQDADCPHDAHCALGLCARDCATDDDCRGPSYACRDVDGDEATECAPAQCRAESTASELPAVVVNRGTDFEERPKLPPAALGTCPPQNPSGGGCALLAILDASSDVVNRFDALDMLDPEQCISDAGDRTFHWEILMPPTLQGTRVATAGISGYRSPTLTILPSSLPSLEDTDAGSDTSWRVRFTVDEGKPSQQVAYFRFKYQQTELSLQMFTDCQRIGHVDGVLCTLVGVNGLPATEAP
jgi:hypothetical protein